jgi:signal transduction histidine kinase
MPVPDENHQNEELVLREREELRAARERMDELLGIASHELRTPLTTIKGNIQLARMRLHHILRELGQAGAPFENELRELGDLLDRAERQVNAQNRLIRDLMDSSSIQAGRIALNPEPCDLARIVREAVEDQRGAIPARSIHIVMAEEETLPIIADAESIEQVVHNLLINALKYSPAQCPVEVRLERQEQAARVAVRDQGPGLTPAEQQQIWERFYQVKGMKRQKGFSAGLGLGLYICKAIIEQHHGKIGVESAKGEGSTFWFILPLASPQQWEAALS